MTESNKPVHQQVEDLLARWNKPTTSDFMERHIGVTPEVGDTRATLSALADGLDHDRNPARDNVDAQRAFADDGDDEGEEADGYDDMNVSELRELLAARELTKSGNKDELIERLREDDAVEESDDEDDDSEEDDDE